MNKQQENKQKLVLATAYQDYGKGLNAHAFFKVSDYETGEDLIQETFMKTWSYLIKGGKIDVMKAFLYHVLNNLIVDTYRKRKTLSLDDLVEKGYDPKVSDMDKLFNILDGKAAIFLIKRLPVTYQKVIQMRYLQDLSLKEMSLITGKTKNTMAVQVHRGLEKLKILYKRGGSN